MGLYLSAAHYYPHSTTHDLTVADAGHGHEAEAPTVSLELAVTVADATHGHTAETVDGTAVIKSGHVTRTDPTTSHVAAAAPRTARAYAPGGSR